MKASPLIAVVGTVLLGLASASLLKEASSIPDIPLWLAALFLGSVLAVNLGRFVLWGYVHKRFPVSMSYPLSGIFFPLVLLLGHLAYGEPLTLGKLVGSVVIMLGVGMLLAKGGVADVED